MNTQDYLTSVAVILVVMVAAAALEAMVPLFAARDTRGVASGRRVANAWMTAQTLSFNFVLSAAVALAAPRLFDGAGLSGPMLLAQTVVGFVAMDFMFGYFAHRSMHAVPSLWRFHRVHHSDSFVDVTTTYRTHPAESAWRYLCLMVPIAVLGLPPAVVAAYRALSAVNGILEHANIRVKPALDSAITRVWVTPNMHKVHHSRDARETDTNYGNLLSLYDRLLGTFTPSTRAFGIRYGLDHADTGQPETFMKLLAMPWKKSGSDPELTQRASSGTGTVSRGEHPSVA